MKSLLFIFLMLLVVVTIAQNTVVTDSSTYSANSTAVLDVQSVHKGFLAPRMTTGQREGITTPAEGLMVFDVTLQQYYVYKSGSWSTMGDAKLWDESGSNVYVDGSGLKVGVGTSSPNGRFIIQGDASAPDEPLFEVKNSDGQSIFAVYEDSVSVNFVESSKGVKGGFAVGGLTPGKSDPQDYLRITPDSVRIYINDASKGAKGGFAVGGLTPGKTTVDNFMDVTPENVFIGHQTGITNVLDGYYGRYNNFIGYKCGYLNDSGYNNVFMGVQCGEHNTTGYRNVFIGTYAGQSNTTGYLNTFVGNVAGIANTIGIANTAIGNYSGNANTEGDGNVFVGQSSGCRSATGDGNVYIGKCSGYFITNGTDNVVIGRYAGEADGYTSGSNNNVFLGSYAGRQHVDGANNVFIGYKAGYNETGSNKLVISNSDTNPLIYGEFDNRVLIFDANVSMDSVTNVNVVNGGEVNKAETGNAHLLPIAYGVVNSNATIASGSGNFSVTWDAANYRYKIDIEGESYFYNSYTSIITPQSDPRMVKTGSVDDMLTVKFYVDASTEDTSGVRFSFVVYKQ